MRFPEMLKDVMKLKIAPDVLKKTSKCREDFSCLKGMTDCICEVKSNINNKIIFIEPCRNIHCKYMLSFGYKYICSCPTRMEIYDSYKV